MSKAWSYTALNSYETCPRRHWALRVGKVVFEPESEELRWGKKVHTALEKCINGTAPLPPELSYMEKVVYKLTSRHGNKVVEKQLAIDSSLRPVRWFDKTAWCRGIIDYGLIGTQNAVLLDWKTGKRKPDNDQLKLFAALMFAHEPYLQQISTAFVWVKDKKLDSDSFTREQTGALWDVFLPRVKRLDNAHQTDTWEPKPSGLCGKWCPVTKKHCEFGR
jgi:CRISPR/Cas system-associated exonuclease Cas4 (RecB family)